MGAQTVIEQVKGIESKPELIRSLANLITLAKYENGHGGYSGSLAEKSTEDLKVFSEPHLLDENDAWKQLEDTLEFPPKWGEVHAYPVKDELGKVVPSSFIFIATCSS